jgi:hypothetical protein
MFTDLTRARRIEAGEGALARAVARGVARGGAAVAVDDLDGGVAVMTRAGLPTNKVIGIGLGDAGALDSLDAIEARWWAVGEPVRIELASLARVEVGRALTARGYQLEGVEHVLVRDLAAPLPSPPPGVAIEDVSSATDDEWLTCAIDGFANPDGANPAEVAVTAAALEPVFRDLSAAEVTRYLARLDGAPRRDRQRLRTRRRALPVRRLDRPGLPPTRRPARAAPAPPGRGARRRRRPGGGHDLPGEPVPGQRHGPRLRAGLHPRGPGAPTAGVMGCAAALGRR